MIHNNEKEEIKINKLHLYGSSRLSIYNTDMVMATQDYNINGYNNTGEFNNPSPIYNTKVLTSTATLPTIYLIYKGKNQLELSNHLGNVLATTTDRRIARDDNGDLLIDYYNADISSTSDYYAFGSAMPGREILNYRFGYTGKEKEKESFNDAYDFGARIYDGRLGRWLALDPLMKNYIKMSPYCGMGNNPILVIDPDGKRLLIRMGLVDLEFKNGKLYEKDSKGEYSKEYTAKEGEYAKIALDNLTLLMAKPAGLKIVNDVVNHEKITIVQRGKDEIQCRDEVIPEGNSIAHLFTNFLTCNLPVAPTKEKETPVFIVFGHELEHALRIMNSTSDWTEWKEKIYNDEKYASHIENLIRAENGLPLRTLYDPSNRDTKLTNSITGDSYLFYKVEIVKGKKFILKSSLYTDFYDDYDPFEIIEVDAEIEQLSIYNYYDEVGKTNNVRLINNE